MVNVRASMLDDERYPIAVSSDGGFPTAPQVMPPQRALPSVPVPSPGIPPSAASPPVPAVNPPIVTNDKFPTVQYAESVVADSPVSSMGNSSLSTLKALDTAQTVAVPSNVSPTLYKGDPPNYKGQPSWNNQPAFDSELLRTPKRPKSFWRQFNVWKVLFFGFMAFVTGVVITSVVLNNMAKSSKAAAAANGAGNSSAEKTGNSTSSTSSTTTSITSSGLFLKDGKTFSMQLYYLPPGSSTIRYRVNLNSTGEKPGDETFEAVRNMTLAIKPKKGSPLAASAETDNSGVVYLDLFYISMASTIAQARLSCPEKSTNCVVTSNSVISTGSSTLHKETSLTAVNFDHAQNWRIFYQNADLNIVQLAGNASAGFGKGEIIYNGTTLAGSSLSAVNVGSITNNINLFFVDQKTQALYYTQFIYSWQKAKPVSEAVIKSWNPTSSLASIYANTPNMMRVYYIGTDLKVWEYSGYNVTSTNTIWDPHPGTAVDWSPAGKSDEEITATAYHDQVRWWQYDSKLGLVEAALDNTTWVENRVL